MIRRKKNLLARLAGMTVVPLILGFMLCTPLSYRKSYRIFFLSSLGRYIPGKVSSILALVYLSQREGVSKVVSGARMTLQLVLQVVSGVIAFAVTLPFWRNPVSVPGRYMLFAFFPAGLMPLHPALVNRDVNGALRLTGPSELELNWGYSYLLRQLGL